MMSKGSELPVETAMASIVQCQRDLARLLDQMGTTYQDPFTSSRDLRIMLYQLGLWYGALQDSCQRARSIGQQQRTASKRTSAHRKAQSW